MSANIPFFRGQNVVLKLYQDNKPIVLLAKNWDIEENATEIADGVNGENRDRLDKVTNYFSGSVDVFQADQEQIEAYMAAQDADDTNQLPKTQSGAVQINHRDGTKAAYLLSELKLGPFKTGMTSRQDAVMLNLKFRFRFYKRIPSI